MKKSRRELALDKLVADNVLRANHNIMYELAESGEKDSYRYKMLEKDCERIEKRYPSLRWN